VDFTDKGGVNRRTKSCSLRN